MASIVEHIALPRIVRKLGPRSNRLTDFHGTSKPAQKHRPPGTAVKQPQKANKELEQPPPINIPHLQTRSVPPPPQKTALTAPFDVLAAGKPKNTGRPTTQPTHGRIR